jgi:predicted translation initiation factor SUI1
MGRANERVILFTGPEELARAAVDAFTAAAGRIGLPWRAEVGAPRPADRTVILGAPGGTSPDETVEYWAFAPGPDAATRIGREVNALIARLLGGRPDAPEPPPKPEPPKKVLTAKLGRETAGRRGKGVTTVFDLPLTTDQLRELAAVLKAKCGTGGTVKDGKIEIQGDHRDRLAAELEKLGYKVKRVGG